MQTTTARQIAQKHRAEKLVLVASRRTDIPRFHTDELVTGLQNGSFHPQGPRQPVWQLTFEPADIHSIGLWSQDFSRWLARRPQVTGYRFWYRFTILPDDPVCKPRAARVSEQLEQLAALNRLEPAGAINVCIDPLIRYRRVGQTRWRYNFSAASLKPILRQVAQLGLGFVTTSVVDPYARVERRLRRLGVQFADGRHDDDGDREAGGNERWRIARRFAQIAASYDVEVRSCCEKALHERGLFTPGRCVDGELLRQLFGPGASTVTDAGQRKKYGCGCTRSLDIGRYTNSGQWSHHCGHDCPQCYARP